MGPDSTKPAFPDLSIIIPTYNRKQVLLMCLNYLKQQTCPASRFEVIVAVDGSTDGTKEYIESNEFPFALKIVEQVNSGPAAARNLGARNASGEYLLFLDDDILATPDLIAEHLSIHKMYSNSIVVGPTPTPSADQITPLFDWQRNTYQSDIDRLNRWGFDAIDHYFCLGANGSLSRDLFELS
jgi:glycosyltransferase involved in cell wall biosynthesis